MSVVGIAAAGRRRFEYGRYDSASQSLYTRAWAMDRSWMSVYSAKNDRLGNSIVASMPSRSMSRRMLEAWPSGVGPGNWR